MPSHLQDKLASSFDRIFADPIFSLMNKWDERREKRESSKLSRQKRYTYRPTTLRPQVATIVSLRSIDPDPPVYSGFPAQRPRPVTPTATATSLTTPQTSSFLTRLPLEIRQEIYALALVDPSVLYLRRTPRNHGHHIRCLCCRSEGAVPQYFEFFTTRFPSEKALDRSAPWAAERGAYSRGCGMGGLPFPSSRHGTMGVLRACHQVYFEAIPVLYGRMVLVLDDLCILTWLAEQVLPPYSLAAIRHLRLTWEDLEDHAKLPPAADYGPARNFFSWDRFWGIVAERMRLVSLGVDVLVRNPRELKRAVWGLDAEWVKPMLMVRGVRNPRVRVMGGWLEEEEWVGEVRALEEEVQRVMQRERDEDVEDLKRKMEEVLDG